MLDDVEIEQNRIEIVKKEIYGGWRQNLGHAISKKVRRVLLMLGGAGLIGFRAV